MHPTILAALQKAQAILEQVGSKEAYNKEELELSKLSKKELVQLVLKYKYPKMDSNKGVIQEAAYAILSEPACVWLDHGTIATLIKKQFPWAETKEANIAWYSSKGIEKEREVLPRKPSKAIAALILAEH